MDHFDMAAMRQRWAEYEQQPVLLGDGEKLTKDIATALAYFRGIDGATTHARYYIDRALQALDRRPANLHLVATLFEQGLANLNDAREAPSFDDLEGRLARHAIS